MRRMALAMAVTTAAAVAVLAGPAAAGAAASAQVRWPSHLVLAEPPRLGIGNQVIDPATGADFALAFTNAGSTSKLRRTALSSGRVKLGPAFPVSSIGLGGRYAWVYGAQGLAHDTLKFRLYRVNRGLARVATCSPG